MGFFVHRMSGKRRKRNELIPGLKITRSVFKLGELILFPSRCQLCGCLLENPSEKLVCRGCIRSLRPARGFRCDRCGRLFYGEQESHLCTGCLDNPPPFSCHRSAAEYEGNIKDLILLLKYRGLQPLAGIFSAFILNSLADEKGLWDELDAIVPVPLHPRRRRHRGFNQAQLIGRAVAKELNLPVIENNLIKVRNNPPQTSLGGRERRDNVRGAYRVRKTGRFEGKKILLIDDVYTTGATVSECSAVLRQASAGDVRALTIAQA